MRLPAVALAVCSLIASCAGVSHLGSGDATVLAPAAAADAAELGMQVGDAPWWRASTCHNGLKPDCDPAQNKDLTSNVLGSRTQAFRKCLTAVAGSNWDALVKAPAMKTVPHDKFRPTKVDKLFTYSESVKISSVAAAGPDALEFQAGVQVGRESTSAILEIIYPFMQLGATAKAKAAATTTWKPFANPDTIVGEKLQEVLKLAHTALKGNTDDKLLPATLLSYIDLSAAHKRNVLPLKNEADVDAMQRYLISDVSYRLAAGALQFPGFRGSFDAAIEHFVALPRTAPSADAPALDPKARLPSLRIPAPAQKPTDFSDPFFKGFKIGIKLEPGFDSTAGQGMYFSPHPTASLNHVRSGDPDGLVCPVSGQRLVNLLDACTQKNLAAAGISWPAGYPTGDIVSSIINFNAKNMWPSPSTVEAAAKGFAIAYRASSNEKEEFPVYVIDKGAVENYGACTRAVDHFAFEWLSSCKGLAARLATSFSLERTPNLLYPGGTSRMSVWAFINTAYGRERVAAKLAKCAGLTPPNPRVDTTGLGDAIKAIRKYVLSNKYANVRSADSDAMADLVTGTKHDDATNWSAVVEAAAPSCTFKCTAPNKCKPIKKPADTTATVRRSDQPCGVTA